MAAEERQLEELFRACDKNGAGHIGPDEFRELCTGFDIGPADSDAIFIDLDHDGDGKVSLEDFAWGFRDFLHPHSSGSRRGSILPPVAEIAVNEELERRHSLARNAWSNLVASVGHPTITKFLNTSGQKLAELYEELQTTETCPQLIMHFEGAFSSLLQDVKKLHEENKKMEEMIMREKVAHLSHLRNLEEELDVQVARVEQQAREDARIKYEAEKHALQERMEAEMAELQTHLRLFQKVNNVLSRGRGDGQVAETNDTKQQAAMENRELRNTLADTKTNLALLRYEMAQLRSEYEDKCRQLNHQQETVSECIHQNDHVHRQLQLLHDANTKLQDTNDSLLSVMDAPGLRSPRPSSPCCCSHASSTGSSPTGLVETLSRNKLWHIPSRTPSDVGSIIDSAPTSLGLTRPDTGDDKQFGIRRLMEDLDSGRSTMRDQADMDSDKSLQEELLLSGCHSSILDNDNDNESEHRKVVNADSRIKIIPSTPFRQPVSLEIPLNPITAMELEPTGPPDRTYKIVFAGDAAVGKSCFIYRFCKGVFINNLGSTLGVDFQVKTIRVDNRNVVLQLWDTAGQERFRSMTKTYFRRADGVMLLYDVTSERSFLNVRQWVQSIDEVTEHRVPIILCGNKVDLRTTSRAQGLSCIDKTQGSSLARDNAALFIETSSKSGSNILDAVLALSREMLTREDVEVQTSSLKITQESNSKTLPCCASKK